MKVSIMRGNQVICSSSDEQMTMEDVNAIRRKERMTDRKSTLSVYVYDPNKDPKPIKLPQDTEKIIEDAKLIAEGKVPGKTVVIDTMPEEVREAEEKTEEDSVEEPSEEAIPVMTSGYVSVDGEAVNTDDIGFTTVASTDEETEDECSSNVDNSEDEDFIHQKEEAKAEAAIELGKTVETEEDSAEDEEKVEENTEVENTTEFNVQSKFTQPVEETPAEEDITEEESVEETTEEAPVEEDTTEEEPVEETPVEEIINRPSASSKVIDDFFAKEAREAKMYGNKGNKNFKQQRGNRGGKGRRIEEY